MGRELPPHAALLRIAAYHRVHEQWYSAESVADALALKRWAAALKSCADRALSPDTDATAIGAGALLADNPEELDALGERLAELGDKLVFAGNWLSPKVDAGWDRERALIDAGLLAALVARYRALANAKVNSHRRRMAGELLLRARGALDGSRAALALREVAWMLDTAAVQLMESAIDLTDSDLGWTAYTEAIAADA